MAAALAEVITIFYWPEGRNESVGGQRWRERVERRKRAVFEKKERWMRSKKKEAMKMKKDEIG